MPPWHYPTSIKDRVIALRDEYEQIFIGLIDELHWEAFEFDLATSAIRKARFFRRPDAWLEHRGPFGMVLRPGRRSCSSLIEAIAPTCSA
jgi:hypothetical protein